MEQRVRELRSSEVKQVVREIRSSAGEERVRELRCSVYRRGGSERVQVQCTHLTIYPC